MNLDQLIESAVAPLAEALAMVFVLCVPNILGLVLLTPVVKEELARFRERVRTVDGVDH